MGGVILRKCITNAFHENKHTWTLSSDWDWVQMWERWRPMVDHAAAISEAVPEPMEEDKEEGHKVAAVGEGSST